VAVRLRGGSDPRLSEAQVHEIRGRIEEGPDLGKDGVTGRRIGDLRRKVDEAFGVACSDDGARKAIRKAGFRRATGRPVRPKADPERQEAFKAEFPAPAKERLPAEAGDGEVKADAGIGIRFMDEARLGRKGITTSVRAERGRRGWYPCPASARRSGRNAGSARATRATAAAAVRRGPRGPRRRHGPHGREGGHEVVGRIPVEARDGRGEPGAHILPVLDGAGRHRAQALAAPESVTLLFLPPHGPETDPTERAVLCLKENRFANRMFEGVADLTESGRKARGRFVGAPGRIAKTTPRSWAVAAS